LGNIVLTGIERSGSSYLVDILNNFSNVVFLNEPPLDYLPHSPYRLGDYIADHRKRILNGGEVQNVFIKGTNNLIHDTLRAPHGTKESRLYKPEYDNQNFVFGFKALTPMLRLIYKVKAQSGVRFFALVRNPIDTIVSQMETGGAVLPCLPDMSEKMKQIYEYIVCTKDMFIKSCLVWRFNTSIILDNADIFTVVRYNSICVNPNLVANVLLYNMGVGKKLRTLVPSEPVKHRDKVSLKAISAVGKICRTNAKKLGVWG
jgi:hypothetical protein